jgi:hypothetical protein
LQWVEHLNYLGLTEYWGGYVNANDLTIRNCRRGVAFMAYAQNGVTDESSFTNVTFENIRDSGVTIWRSDGIRFTDCTFTKVANGNNVPGNQHEGIRAENAWVNVDGCEFNNQPYGVVLAGSDIFSRIHEPSTVVSSDFNTSMTGIELMTYNIRPNRGNNQFDNNEFLSGELGIYVDGVSPIEITNSDFETNLLGVQVRGAGAGGSEGNIVSNNQFSGIDRGCLFEGANNGLSFDENCFTASIDSDVNLIGEISDQGDPVFEAGNEFSKSGVPEIRSSDNLRYHVWNGRVPGDPEFLDNSTNSNQLPSDAFLDEECGAMFAPNPNPDDCQSSLASIAEILSLLSEIENFKQSVDSEDPMYAQAINLKVELYKQLTEKVLTQVDGVQSELNQNQLKSMMQSQPEFSIRSFVPSISMNNGEYLNAKLELDAINTSSIAESNYIEAQKIYVDFHLSGRTEVSSSQIQFLRNMGSQEGSLNTFGKTILYLVSGERLTRSAPYVDAALENRSSRNVENRTVSCYPNPVQQQDIHLSIQEGIVQAYEFTLDDFAGNRVTAGTIRSNTVERVSTDNMVSGLYVVTIYDTEENIIFVNKVVVTK